MRQIEILSMVAEFIRDDQDNVWFTFANKITYRRCIIKIERDPAEEEAAREFNELQEQKTQFYARELMEIEDVVDAGDEGH